MDLTKILAISGKPGLYKMLSQTKAGFIVESLTDGRRFPVFAHERVSTLEEISIFIAGEDDMPLKEVLRKFFDKLEGKPGLDAGADSKALKSFFLETIPSYDQEKVYVSDMRKTISWYNLLLEKGLLEFSDEEPEPSEHTDTKENTGTPETDAPAVE